MEELYNQLYNDGKYTKTFEDFNVQFGSPEKAKKLYTALNQSGDYTKSFDEFQKRFITPVKIQDSASADPAVESVKNDMGSTSEEPLSAWQSIKNTFKKAGERLYDVVEFWGTDEGANSGLDIATNSFYSLLSSQKAVDEYAKNNPGWLSEGMGSEKTIDAIKKYKEEQDESNFATKGIVASAKEGDVGGLIAGSIEGLVNAFSSGVYFLGTLGTGVFSEVAAENYITYNEQKAENLGVSLDELIRSGEADNLAPVGLGAVSTGLERFGFGKVLKATAGKNIIKNTSAKLIYNRKARNVANILAAGGTEFTTEILQHATDKINEEFGRTAGTEEDAKIVQTTFDAIFSEEGLEAGLQGLIGGSGMTSIGTSYRAMNTIRTTVDGDLITKNIDDLSKLRVKFNKATDKTEKAGIQKLIDTKESEIADSVRKGNDIYNSLSEGQLKEIENLTDLADTAAYQITELNKKFRAGEIDKAGYDLAVEGFKSEYDGVRQQLIDMNLEQNIKTAEDIAKEKGLDLDVMTAVEVEALMNSDKVSEQNRKTYFDNKSKGYELSAFVIGNKIVIDKDIARKTGSINVGMHEVLHPVFNKLIGNAEQQGKMVRQFRRAMTSSQRRFVDAEMKKRGYIGKEYNTEYVNVFSDVLRKKQINYDKTTFEKIGDAVVSIFKPVGYTNIGFESGKDVYNFIKEFDQSAEQGKLTTKAAEVLKDVDLSDAGLQDELQASKSLSPEQTTEVTNDILAVKQLAEEEAAIAAKFGKEPIKGGKQARLEQKVIATLKPIIEKVVTNRTQVLYDPIAADAKKAVSRKEFQDSMRSDLEVMVLNEYNGSQDIEKFLINRGYLRANNLAKRLGIESQEDGGIKSDVTAAKDVASTEDVQTIDRSGAVERGQATFDQLDLVDDALISDIEKEISRELKTRSAKGTLSENVPLKLNNKIYETSWIEDFIDKTLFKKILKKWGAIGESNGKTKIPGAYIDFLNDQKNFDIIMKALPVKTIKKSYSKLFTLEKIGRELTAEGNPIFRVAPIDKKTFLQYFLDGKKTTILERQKQLAREIITPVAKETLANYATHENLAALKEMQELAPDTSLDVQAGIIINAQLEDLQSKLDRYKGEEKGFDVIQFSKTISSEQKENIKVALNSIAETDSNLNFNKTIVQDILDGIDKVEKFKDLANLIWNAGDKALGIKALREYRVEVLKLLADKLNYSDTVKFLISAITGFNKIFKKQQTIIGYTYAMSTVRSRFDKAKSDQDKAAVIEDFLKFTSRSIRTLKIDGLTTNRAIYNDILVPIMGDPNKFGFTLTEETVGKNEKVISYINRDGKRLYGLTDVTRIKSNFEAYRNAINQEATETISWMMNEAKDAIGSNNIDAFIGFLSLLSADQRGPIRKMSSAGFAFKNLALENTVLEHETEALDIFNAWKRFAQGKLSETKLIKFLKDSKVNLVSKEFDKILKESRKEVAPKKPANIGKARYDTKRSKDFIKKLNKEGLISMLGKIDTSSKVLQASKTLNKDFNNIIENETKISGKSTISEAKSKMLGKNKGGWRFFVPPSADDFAGLMYRLLGKGDVGDKNAKWFKDNLFDPYGKGIRDFESYKQQTVESFRRLKKSIKNVPKDLGKTNETGFTNDVAIRVYLWNKKGIEIPGLDKNDIKELVDIVNNNQDFKNFADQVDNLLQGYPEPENNWLAGTITTDVINKINTAKREEFLQEWQANADEIFSNENINKLRAAFGEDYVEALKDMLYRMKTGRNRPSGSNKLTNQFMNWVNDSVGTIMFFNTRSALLQTLSIANFINWGDNNPINAAKAFANQKQFWSDFTMLFNSDFLKQRRSGLKNDINADDIASAAETSTNKVKAALSSILKMGFLPTQIADSFAIAMGGASFLRNRIDSYIKEGLSQQEAESKAFLDFQEVAEETQQSSRPDRISQQQASPLGRIILAFANTPMQYMRLTKKAILDIKNKRGDLKTNVSKIVYYTAIQNVIFASLQAALFASLFDDEEEEAISNKQTMVANSMLDTLLRGMGIGGAVVSTVKNIGLEIDKQSKKPRPDYREAAIRSVDLSPPLSSKLRKLMSAGRAFSYKNVRDQMKGFSLENPAFYAGGQVVSAVTNVPLDRVIKKADNIRLAMDNDTKLWQKVALALGYSAWDIGIVQKEKSKGKSGFGKVPTWKKIEWKKSKW